MSAVLAAFREAYANALRLHLDSPNQNTLAEGYELGRRALVEGVSILDLTEHHFRLLDELGLLASPAAAAGTAARARAALEFLLQTLAALDVATRGFLDSTRSYELQRLRAEDLAGRDAFRTALVESLQDGFFVADADGTITEVNSAFGALTGYGPEAVPFRPPHPWTDESEAPYPALGAETTRFVMPARHRDGRRVWLAVSTSSLRSPEDDEHVFVGTVRDVTAEHDARSRDHAVSRLTTAVGAATTVAEVLEVGLEELRRAIGAETAVVSMRPNSQTAPQLYVSGPVAEAENGTAAPASGDAGSDTAVSRRVIDARARALLDRARMRPDLAVFPIPEGAASSEGIVARLGETGDAALWVRFAAPRAISPGDWSLFSLLYGHLNLAVQRARNFDQARSTSLTLQRAMLGPVELPPGFAVHYEPALPPLEIGGDWYDVVKLRNGTLGIVVGDCVGRGLSAAVVMGQLRTAAQALLLRGAGPAQLLSELDAVAARIPGAMCTTVCAAILDPVRGLIRYSSAGHMPPVLAGPGRTGRLLEGGRAVPLATFDTPQRPEATTALAPGSTLVLFTDGLVEQRGVDIDTRFEELADELSGLASYRPRDVADAVLDRLRPEIGYDDDIAMVVYRQPPRPLRLDVPAEAARLTEIRRALTGWLSSAAVEPEQAADLVSAANEACTNSIEHAYATGTAGRVVVTAECARGAVYIAVTDTGAWRPLPEDPGARGRGLAMMRALADEVDIDRTATGTRVELVAALPSVTFSAASTV